ncbi:MAG: hypothetical protein HUJ51_02030 [Eggerthellaceae bacterium]|nr:hypothetical protein [Eggerthellaceae bacterium]
MIITISLKSCAAGVGDVLNQGGVSGAAGFFTVLTGPGWRHLVYCSI